MEAALAMRVATYEGGPDSDEGAALLRCHSFACDSHLRFRLFTQTLPGLLYRATSVATRTSQRQYHARSLHLDGAGHAALSAVPDGVRELRRRVPVAPASVV